MAYQPLEVTARPPMLDAWSQLNQTLGQRRQEAGQAQLEEQQRKRQEHADFVSAYQAAKKLADSGDHAGAAALMSQFKGRYGESPSALATPAPPAAAPGGAPQGGSPMPDALEFKPQMPREEGPDGVGPDGRPVAPQIDPGFADSLPMGAPGPGPAAPPTAAASLMGAAPGARPAPPADHPLVAANEASKARDQQRGHGVLYFTPPGGTEQSYDAEAVREQHLQQRAQELDGLAAQSGPEFQEVYKELRPALIMNDQLDPTDIVKVINAKAAAKAAEAQFGYRQENDAANRAQRGELRHDAIVAGHENTETTGRYRVAAAQAGANAPLKVDTAARGDAAALESAIDKVFAQAGGKQGVAGMDALHAGAANINASGPNAVLAHKDAMIQLARYFRGTTPTEGEMKLLYDHLGGTPGAIDAFIQKLQTGDINTAAIENLRSSFVGAFKEAEDKRDRLMTGLAERTGGRSEFATMGPNVNAQIRARAALFGLKNPDLPYAEGEGTQTVLGAGRAPKKKPATKTKAAPAGKTPDQQAVEFVNDPATPHDATWEGIHAKLVKKGLLKK